MDIARLYPTPEHARAAEVVRSHFAARPGVEAVLLTCSCARGKAAPSSCVDVTVLLPAEGFEERRAELEAEWEQVAQSQEVFAALRQHGTYAHLDLEFTDGVYVQENCYHGWCSGPDSFELEVGNLVAYAVPLYERGDRFSRLQEKWLPYYGEGLRRERLEMVRGYGLNNLDHIAMYVDRGLYFQAFQRLYHAFGEFLQALFIARRVYPVAYDKWIRDQVVELLNLPDLYPRLVGLLEIHHFESQEIAEHGRELWAMMEEYVTAEIRD
jgi:predicted nucleotidyltransferase